MAVRGLGCTLQYVYFSADVMPSFPGFGLGRPVVRSLSFTVSLRTPRVARPNESPIPRAHTRVGTDNLETSQLTQPTRQGLTPAYRRWDEPPAARC